MNIWEREVQKYQQIIKENSINTLGEYEHPNRTKVDPLEAVMKIIELKMDNGLVCGKAKILNNNSPKTNQLKALIDEGFKIGVSSRGVGSVKGDIVENFSLLTYDIVSEPSDYNANLSGIMESMQDKNFLITESGEIKEVPVTQEIAKELKELKDLSEINEVQDLKEDSDNQEIQIDIVETKKELSDFEKKIAQEKLLEKFNNIFNDLKTKKVLNSLEESFKVKDKNSALITLNMIKNNIKDEKTKQLVDGVIEFLNQ